jgi:DNA-binding MarR family transcriptional regulator
MIDDMSSDTTARADFGLLLALAFQSYVAHLHEHLACRGFSPARSAFGPVLRTLRGRQMTLTVLAHDLGITKQAVARVVEDMRTAGLVEQLPDPTDGRARLLSLTARGDAMVDAAIEIGTAFEARLASDLGPGPARALRSGLERIAEHGDGGADLAARRVRSM